MEAAEQDRELVRLAQRGDQRAFEALVVKYQRRVARHVARYVRRAADVKDVVQETFIRAYRGLRSFRGDSRYHGIERLDPRDRHRRAAEVMLRERGPEAASPARAAY
jgi:hypothetical protein